MDGRTMAFPHAEFLQEKDQRESVDPDAPRLPSQPYDVDFYRKCVAPSQCLEKTVISRTQRIRYRVSSSRVGSVNNGPERRWITNVNSRYRPHPLACSPHLSVIADA